MATKMVRVNSLAVAKRWLKEFKEKYPESHHTRLGIWERPRQYNSRKGYNHSDSMIYVVGHSKAIETKISHLGKRLNENDL